MLLKSIQICDNKSLLLQNHCMKLEQVMADLLLKKSTMQLEELSKLYLYDYKSVLTNEKRSLCTVVNKQEYRTQTLKSKHSDPNTLENINYMLGKETFGLPFLNRYW